MADAALPDATDPTRQRVAAQPMSATDDAMARELRGQAIVHALLYLGMIFGPAVALIVSRNQPDRWLWITYVVAVMSLLILPTPTWSRWLLLALYTAVAFTLRFTLLR